MARRIVTNLKHLAGDHCESTSMRDVIEHVGLPISEPMAFGLDGTMGFVFIDNTKRFNMDARFNMNLPFFAGGKNGTITENSLACRILGLTIKHETFKSTEEAWTSSKKYLDRDAPLILQVDMGYLSYFNWEEEFHFGMHAVVLCGHNDDRVAYICDNGFTQILEVPLDELKKARSSKFGPTFMHPKNGQFIIGKRPDGKKPPFAAAVKLAIKQVADNMRRASINTNGLSGMKLMLDSIPNWPDVLNDEIVFNGKKIPKAYFTLEMLYGYIEEYGTGGGNFRNLYSRFLKELSSHQEILEGSNSWKDQEISFLNDACDLIKESGDLWSRFAQEIKKGLTKSVENCLETIDFKKLEEILEKIILLEEEAFTNLSKIKI